MDQWESQANVASVHQLYSAGMTPAAVRWRLRSGRWQSPHPGVVVMHSGPLTAAQLQWAALLWAGSGAALCSATAASLDGLRGYDDALVHVCLPQERRLVKREGIVLHRSDFLGQSEIHPLHGPRRTRIDRSVVELAAGRVDADDAVAVLASAVQQRLVSVDSLQERVVAAPRMRHRKAMLAALFEIAGGSHSLPELEFLRLIRRGGLPEPRRQYRMDAAGRVRYLDLFWDEFRICVEVDGRFHIVVTTWWADIDRDFDISADGVKIIHVTAKRIRTDPEGLIDGLRRALIAAGWQAPPMKGVIGVLARPRDSFDQGSSGAA
ncbi:type IV toxin-antitoxin system AbiEi family antitoxin domain-containing protein [Acidothermaceae bacterium B102]|nr:type IV toxin-antitoxin system AbiEi family antitoxin domain-containing protein [Acidothermaceae bacterium B102]